jgi:hypothetical protein
MKLKAVKGYKNAKYPTLEQHLLKKNLRTKVYLIAYAIGSVTIISLTAGCGAISP